MVINKAIDPGGIKHNKPEANAQLLIIDGLIVSRIIKDPRPHLARSDQSQANYLFDYPIDC
jgi:hypothetical protein